MIWNTWQIFQISRGCNMNAKFDIKLTAKDHWQETRAKRIRNYIFFFVLGFITNILIGG
jgi:hypothetical protein